MNNFSYHRPQNLNDALALLTSDVRPLGGGTDLLGMLKDGLLAPAALVDVQELSELHGITESDAGLRIGAATPIADVLAWPGLWKNHSLLAMACQVVGFPEIRTMGTIGGNLCQRPRCVYFRHPLATRCLKRGGDLCYPTEGRADGLFAVFGDSPCRAVHPSDIAPALVALHATLQIAAPGGERTVSADQFFSAADLSRENILRPDELLVSIEAPRPATGTRGTYLKSKRRPSHDFSRAAVALSAVVQDGVVTQIDLVLGSVALVPWRLGAVEQLLAGKRLNATLVREAADLAARDARPVATTGPSNGSKIALVRGLVFKALSGLMA
ncbi:MAG: FAD binding domain-containing protein [Chloroflexi bacterium]|nr:FAD binding domain-containing protein [Chloroflexota bacterium]